MVDAAVEPAEGLGVRLAAVAHCIINLIPKHNFNKPTSCYHYYQLTSYYILLRTKIILSTNIG